MNEATQDAITCNPVHSRPGIEAEAWLDWGRVMATISVVLLHASVNVVTQAPFGTLNWWAGNIYDTISRWCVPVYVMLSGALLLHPSKKEELGTFFKKRASRILVPLLVWSAFYLGYKLYNSPLKAPNNGLQDYLLYIINSVNRGRPYYHLWYIYMLIGLYLFTPAMRAIIRGSSRTTVIFIACSSLAVAALNQYTPDFNQNNVHFTTWFVPYIGYFLMGHIIRTTEKPWPLWVSGASCLLSMVTTAYLVYKVWTISGLYQALYFFEYTSITVIPMSLSLMMFMRSFKYPQKGAHLMKTLAGLSMGIYLIHPVLLTNISRAGLSLTDPNAWLMIPAVCIMLILITGSLVWAMSKVPVLRRIF